MKNLVLPMFDDINQIEIRLKPTSENITKIAEYVKDLLTDEISATIWISRNDGGEIDFEIYESQNEVLETSGD